MPTQYKDSSIDIAPAGDNNNLWITFPNGETQLVPLPGNDPLSLDAALAVGKIEVDIYWHLVRDGLIGR